MSIEEFLCLHGARAVEVEHARQKLPSSVVPLESMMMGCSPFAASNDGGGSAKPRLARIDCLAPAETGPHPPCLGLL
jgi:hypothetical protein